MSASTVDRLRELTVQTLEPVLQIDGDRLDLAFTLVLLGFTALIVGLTFQYNQQTQLAPLVVGIPTLLLLLGLVMVQVSTRAARLVNGLTTSDVLGVEERVEGVKSESEKTASVETSELPYQSRLDALTVSAWVLLLFVLILSIGFTVGIPVYLLLIYRIRAGLSWGRAVGYTALIWAFIAVIFLYVLNSPLYPGVLEVTIPFLR